MTTPTVLDDADTMELEDLAGRVEITLDAFNNIYGNQGEQEFIARLERNR